MGSNVPIVKATGYAIQDLIENLTGQSPAAPPRPFRPYIDKEPPILPSIKSENGRRRKKRPSGPPSQSSGQPRPVMPRRSRTQPSQGTSPSVISSRRASGVDFKEEDDYQNYEEDANNMEAVSDANGQVDGEAEQNVDPYTSADENENNLGDSPHPVEDENKILLQTLPKSKPPVNSRRTQADRDADLEAYKVAASIRRQEKESARSSAAKERGRSKVTSQATDKGQISKSKEVPKSKDGRVLGDMSRTYVDGMQAPDEDGSTSKTTDGKKVSSRKPAFPPGSIKGNAERANTEFNRRLGDMQRTYIDGMLPPSTPGANSATRLSSQRISSNLGKSTNPTSQKLVSKDQQPKSELARPLGDNTRTYVDGMWMPSTAARSQQPSLSRRQSASKPKSELGRRLGHNTRTYVDGMLVPSVVGGSKQSNQPNKQSNPKPKSEMNGQLGDNTRTYVDGLWIPSAANSVTSSQKSSGFPSKAQAQTTIQHPPTPAMKSTKATLVPKPIRSKSENIVKSNMNRVLGDQTRTYIEGMLPPSTTTASRLSTRATSVADKQLLNDRRNADKTMPSGSMPRRSKTEPFTNPKSELNRPLGDNMRTYLEGMLPPTTHRASSTRSQTSRSARSTPAIDKTITPAVRSELGRALGDNFRTYVDGMATERGNENARTSGAKPDNDETRIKSNIKSELGRRLGDQMRTYVEGISTEAPEEPEGSKKKGKGKWRFGL